MLHTFTPFNLEKNIKIQYYTYVPTLDFYRPTLANLIYHI